MDDTRHIYINTSFTKVVYYRSPVEVSWPQMYSHKTRKLSSKDIYSSFKSHLHLWRQSCVTSTQPAEEHVSGIIVSIEMSRVSLISFKSFTFNITYIVSLKGNRLHYSSSMKCVGGNALWFTFSHLAHALIQSDLQMEATTTTALFLHPRALYWHHVSIHSLTPGADRKGSCHKTRRSQFNDYNL